MTAKEFLSQYRELDLAINAKLDEAARLRALAERVAPSAERSSGGGNVSDRVGRTVARIVDLEREVDREIDRLVEVRREIERAIEGVGDERYRVILRERYMNGKKWSDVSKAVRINDMKWIFKLHGRALKEVEKIFSPIESDY